MSKFRISWELCKASASVVNRHRKLLWFPVVNFCFLTVITLFFAAPVFVSLASHPTGYRWTQSQHWEALVHLNGMKYPEHQVRQSPDQSAKQALEMMLTGGPKGRAANPLWAGFFFLVYFSSMFSATFFNVAFYSEIMCALNGRGVSFRRGFALARSRIPSILAWSLLAGGVGWLIRWVESRVPFLGRVVIGFVGLAWSVAAVFAIPVIIQQESLRNPVKILKQSASVLKRTWGEGLIGWAGVSMVELAILLGSFVLLAALLTVAYLVHGWAVGIAFTALWLAGLIFIFYVLGLGRQVYRCALYLFAAEGVVPAPYQREMMDLAWKIKGGSQPV